MRQHDQRDKERGACMVEYALLVSLICLVAVVSVRAVGERIDDRLGKAADQLVAAGGGHQED